MTLGRIAATTLVAVFLSSALLGESSDKRGKVSVQVVDFERHIEPLLSRLGCNAGACHGSFEGKGGFRLSLFGQSPAKDHAALVGDPQSRRVVRSAPDESLILAKPSGRMDHEGGVRLSADSWEYDLIRRWIGEGAVHRAGSGEVRELRIQGQVPSRLLADQAIPLTVVAEFADGQSEDVTALATFLSRQEGIVKADESGRVRTVSHGYGVVTAMYRSAFAHRPLLVVGPSALQRPTRLPPVNVVDEEIDRRLDSLDAPSAPAASDEEFLRRATLDVLGTLPTPQEVRQFCGDASSSKRSSTIERLLAHPRRAVVWASKMCDITACSVDTMEQPTSLRPKRAQMWHDWFRKRFAENMPYDQLARGVLCATSRQGESVDDWVERASASQLRAEASFVSDYADRPQFDLFWRRVRPDGEFPVEDMAELTASAFLGLRLHCARCHHHPYDRWSQRDFAGFAQSLARVQFGSSTELRTAINRQLDRRRAAHAAGESLPELVRVQEVYLTATPRPLIDAVAEAGAPAKAPGGPLLNDNDPREGLARWMTSADNPYFARSFVNRIWAKYFGAGLIEPVDDLSASNPATHPQLLERLADEFVRSGFDVAHIERMILSSNAYQRSSRLPSGSSQTAIAESVAPIRTLPAETLIDALNKALETVDHFGSDVPPGSTAHEVAPNRVSEGGVNSLFRILGRGDRRSLCDCDRSSGPSIRRPMYLMSDTRVLDKIREGRLARLLEDNASTEAIVEELFLATLSRLPRDDERSALKEEISTSTDRRETLADILWALVNTREFATNH